MDSGDANSAEDFKMFPVFAETNSENGDRFITTCLETQGWRDSMEDTMINT